MTPVASVGEDGATVAASLGPPPATAVALPSPRSRRLGDRLRRGRWALVGTAIVLVLAALAVFAPVVAPYSPTEQRLTARLKPPGFVAPDGRVHVAGTDQFGRDILSRLIYGVRIPLLVGFSAALLGALIGLLIGLPAGYFGGAVDTALSTLIEVQLSMPFILIALAVVALFGPSVTNIVLVFAVTSWATNARVARAVAISLRNSQFVEAARSLGAGDLWILARHVVVNALPPILVVASVQVAHIIIYESAFAFFGLGVPPPEPTWGNMLADARNYLHEAWWMGTFPGLCIMLVALAVNLFGDALRDILDPREVQVGRDVER